jgi:hypothetical protein
VELPEVHDHLGQTQPLIFRQKNTSRRHGRRG